jgi:carbon monoxide dehydrogenase subunit G
MLLFFRSAKAIFIHGIRRSGTAQHHVERRGVWQTEVSRLKIEGSYTFNAPREKVWEVLLDPKVMAQCMPGCENMNEIGPDQYEATMKVGVASVKGTYKGKVSIKDKLAPSHYVLSGEGSGGPGFMQGDVSIDLEENQGQTVLKYSTDAKVGGLIASIGQRMLNGVAKMMMDQFFKKVESFI